MGTCRSKEEEDGLTKTIKRSNKESEAHERTEEAYKREHTKVSALQKVVKRNKD